MSCASVSSPRPPPTAAHPRTWPCRRRALESPLCATNAAAAATAAASPRDAESPAAAGEELTVAAVADDAPAHRQFCHRCQRALCICAQLPRPLPNRTAFFLLQTRTERFNSISTARIAALGLENCRVLWPASKDDAVPAPADLPPGAGLLFPSANATLLSPGAPPPAGPTPALLRRR